MNYLSRTVSTDLGGVIRNLPDLYGEFGGHSRGRTSGLHPYNLPVALALSNTGS